MIDSICWGTLGSKFGPRARTFRAVQGDNTHQSYPSKCSNSLQLLHDRAMRRYDSYSRQSWPALQRTQSALLLTVQAMHLDSVKTLVDRASEAMMNCTTCKLCRNARKARQGSCQDVEEEISKQTVRSCYIIDILISCSTNQGVSITDQVVEDEVKCRHQPSRRSVSDTFIAIRWRRQGYLFHAERFTK